MLSFLEVLPALMKLKLRCIVSRWADLTSVMEIGMITPQPASTSSTIQVNGRKVLVENGGKAFKSNIHPSKFREELGLEPGEEADDLWNRLGCSPEYEAV